ncbi:MAG: SCP2 sterol-binding domain-containing protein [Desulfobacteraceae bacterium]|nr:SCP2 sterol-binding domain-containing protein [Desulfobacteraceae bacterium]
MSYELIKANLNLYAVLKNLEDLVKYDPETASLTKDWDISIQFSVIDGPKAYIEFKNGVCSVGRGKYETPVVSLWFLSAAHLNSMMDGKGNPIPLKGFTKLGFLTKEFSKVTERLEYFLKPTDELLKDQAYLELNTRLTMNTAAFASREIGLLDPIGKMVASHIGNGAVNMKILPEGPAVHISFKNGNIEPGKGEKEKPMALMHMKDLNVANDFLNGRTDAFTVIASGDLIIKGQTPMLDSMGLILDRVPYYLS